MTSFFTLIYIVPNRFSDERITVGVLANIEGVPHFSLSDRKLNFAIFGFSAELKTAIRRGFRFMDFDVNKIKRGEEALSLFDPPYSLKLLKALAHKKRGVVQYSDVFEIDFSKAGKGPEFKRLYQKFMGELYLPTKVKVAAPNFKAQFKDYISSKKFANFDHNYKLTAENFPFIYKDMTVDLCRKSNYFTIFYTVDFSKSIQTIQGNISKFRTIVQSLQQVSSNEGLSKGRYYLVYESTTSRNKLELINAIKAEKNLGYNIIRMTEMVDKV